MCCNQKRMTSTTDESGCMLIMRIILTMAICDTKSELRVPFLVPVVVVAAVMVSPTLRHGHGGGRSGAGGIHRVATRLFLFSFLFRRRSRRGNGNSSTMVCCIW